MILRLTYYEVMKTFLKKRTYLGFVVVAAIVPLVVIGMKIEGGRFLQMATRRLQDDFLFIGNLFNGWFVAYQIMNSLWFHIPLLISFVAGDQLAGEATGGTYRLILIRPVSRIRIFIAKYLTTLLYTAVFVAFLGLLSITLAQALLGGGDMIVIERGILILPESEVASRFSLAYILAIWSMVAIASIGFFFSSFVENAIGPIVATMGLLIISFVLMALPLEAFEGLRPYLLTTHLNVWQKGFNDPIPWGDILTGVLVLGAYTLTAVGSAALIFVRRDILS